MELNAAITDTEAGLDISTWVDISSTDLRIYPEKIGSGTLNDVYLGQRTCSHKVHLCTVKKVVRDSSLLPALFAVKQIQAATAVLQVCVSPDQV